MEDIEIMNGIVPVLARRNQNILETAMSVLALRKLYQSNVLEIQKEEPSIPDVVKPTQ